jgi:hypothetical protein
LYKGVQGVARKVAAKRVSERSGDQYLIRLPPGLRDRIVRRAAQSGRSVSAEIVEAIEKHLDAADFIAEMREFIEQRRADIESIPVIRRAVQAIEPWVSNLTDGVFVGTLTNEVFGKRGLPDGDPPLLTASWVQIVRTILREKKIGEREFLDYLQVESMEKVRGINRALHAISELEHPPNDPRSPTT